MKDNEIQKLSFIRTSFANGIVMLLIALLAEMLKSGINASNSSVVEVATGYVLLNAIVYVYGIIVLIVLFLDLKGLKNFNQIYFFISIIILGILCFVWIPHYNLITAFFKGTTLSGSSSMDDVFGFAQSAYSGLKDISVLNTGMYMFFANGMFHWAIRYFEIFKKDENIIVNSIPVNNGTSVINVAKDLINVKSDVNINNTVLKEEAVDLSVIYRLMNESSCINKKDSKYWIFSFENIFVKENEINKRYLRIRLFNRNLNENNNLMRLYFKINGEELYQDYFKVDDTYQNKNFLIFEVERDLAEERFDIEVTGYIVDGRKVELKSDEVGKIDIVHDPLRLEMIKEYFFDGDEEKCSNVPIINDSYWLCSCGMYHDSDIRCEHCGKTKKEILKMIHFKEKDLLQNLSHIIDINIEEDVNQIKEKAINRYVGKYGFNREEIDKNISRDVLFLRQKELVDDTIHNIIKEKPVKYETSLNFEENLENYAINEAIGIISKDMILNALDISKCQLDYKKYISEQKKKQKNKIKIGTICGLSTVLIVLAMVIAHKNATEFKINKFDYVLNTYDTQFIEMKNFNDDIEFKSNNEDIVTVSYDGEMTGLNEGKTSIIVYDNNEGEEYKLNITVVDNYTDHEDEDISNDDIDTPDDDSMIFSNSDSVYLTESDLYGLTQWELRIARNEIYARHGCTFQDETLQDYFNNCSWYNPANIPATEGNNLLNEVEKENAKFIKAYEKERGYL